MKRDLDLVRELLLKIEGGQSVFDTISSEDAVIMGVEISAPMTQTEADNLRGHLDLLDEAGLIVSDGVLGGGTYHISRITWEGYEYLDSVRDPETWRKTKEGASVVKNWSVETIKEIAKGLVKKQVEEWSGVKVP